MRILVAGAGVVGLAVARALSLRGHEIIVAEKADAIGSGTSSRNSEVLHGGMYYPTGSLKARFCVEGRRSLYAYCESHGVPYRRCQKLIVATSASEEAKIAAIYRLGLDNDVEGLSQLTGDEARRLEPNLFCTAAVLSKETGIIDTHALMLALRGDLESSGGALALRTPLESVTRERDGWLARFGGQEPETMAIDAFVNCAGLDAQNVAARVDGFPASRIPKLTLAKGNYFSCAGPQAFSRLIYPAPVDGGLGVHVTFDLTGRVRFGPDVEWIDEIDYDVRPERALSFYDAIRRYWPGLPDNALSPDYAGVRPKISGPGQTPADFVIDGPNDHGLPGLVHLFGVESPGLTSSLAIANYVARLLG
jgi:L-2-hydroxyglutarate oxidase LhgO